jgi:hypothetical protein
MPHKKSCPRADSAADSFEFVLIAAVKSTSASNNLFRESHARRSIGIRVSDNRIFAALLLQNVLERGVEHIGKKRYQQNHK